MKRLLSLLLCLALAGSLTACRKSSSMYIEPAKLTEDEENIAKLVGFDAQNPIYDFRLDDTVESMGLYAYELVDGAWKPVFFGGGRQFIDSKGRLALGFDNIEDGIRISLQSEHHSGSQGYERDNKQDAAGTSRATDVLEERKEFVYDQEIPLVIQIHTSKNEIRTGCVDYFFEPEFFEGYGYDSVYAVTILFSQKPASELSVVF